MQKKRKKKKWKKKKKKFNFNFYYQFNNKYFIFIYKTNLRCKRNICDSINGVRSKKFIYNKYVLQLFVQFYLNKYKILFIIFKNKFILYLINIFNYFLCEIIICK